MAWETFLEYITRMSESRQYITAEQMRENYHRDVIVPKGREEIARRRAERDIAPATTPTEVPIPPFPFGE